MNDDLQSVEQWAGALLAKLSPTQRRAINQKIGVGLRRIQARRIAAQKAPDGESFARRKNRKNVRDKSGRIKRQKAAMFSNLRKTRYLKVKCDTDQLSVGFYGRIADIARVHHFGRVERVSRSGPLHHYRARPLLGFSNFDRSQIGDALLEHLLEK